MSLSSHRVLACLALAVFAAATPAHAYYHFINYLNSGNAPEKFDLTALPANTVTFVVSENGPATYSPTDTFNSVLAQIRQAAAVWNGVATSSLRVAFGGLENGSTPQNAPGGDVVFEDLPPGVEGFGGPTSLASPVTAADGSQFLPILRSSIHLNRNLMLAPGPSYNQSFLLTTVHEMGHALGLQHTFTSAAMSQATTRATSLTHPIDSDDIAGISVLYPNAAFKQLGSITGHVTAGGKPVHLASVVALPVGSGAISAVTNPDGSFRMDGMPPGQYTVYVHTMPPDADIYGPWNADGSVAAASGPINTTFYSLFGTSSATISQSFPVGVTAGAVSSGVNLAATTRASVPFYDGQVYGFFGATAVMPAPANINSPNLVTVVASVVGLGSNGQAPGLSVQIPGGASSVRSNGVRPYQSNGYTYIALDLNFAASAQPGPQHMVFSTPDYTYVLPSAMYLTQSAPPSVTAVTNNGDGTATITGTNWNAATQLYFDSLPATINSIDVVNQVATVIPPAGANGQQATLTAYNPDGQNSSFLQSASPVTYSYGVLTPPSITSITPSSLPAGTEAMVDIQGSGFSFTTGANSVGFGTSDILVRRIFVVSANHLQVDVSIPASASLSNPDVTVISGFARATVPAGFQITAPVPGQPTAVPILVNDLPGLTGAYAGAYVSLYGVNLAASTSTPVTVTIGGTAIPVTYSSPGQLNLVLPSTLQPGPAILIVNNGQSTSFPVLVNIDPQPASFAAVQLSDGTYIDSSQSAHVGNTLIVTLVNFAPGVTSIAPSQVQIGLGGVMLSPIQITQIQAVTQISFQITQNVPTGPSEQLVVYFNGLSSYPASIQVLP